MSKPGILRKRPMRRWPPPITEPQRTAVSAVLDDGPWTDGPWTTEVESGMVEITAAPYAVAFSSCTAALHAVLAATADLDTTHLYAPTWTFAGTLTGAAHLDLPTTLTDVRPDDHTTEPPPEPGLLTIGVDINGVPHRLPRGGTDVITDACQSLGTLIADEHIGATGTHCWSFSTTKALPAPAGGCVTTDRPDLAEQLRELRDYGTDPIGDRSTRPVRHRLGHNWRPSEVDMALVAGRMTDTMTHWVPLMRDIGDHLVQHAAAAGFTIQTPMPDSRPAWHKIRIGHPAADDGEHLADLLAQHGVPTHRWGLPLHHMPVWEDNPNGFPNADQIHQTTVCLGTATGPHWCWTDNEITHVTAALEQVAQLLDQGDPS